MPAADGWDPAQYDRFAYERRQPFRDLVGLVTPIPGGRAIDLGCGTGELTHHLHTCTEARETIGIDRSPAMLADRDRFATGGVDFQVADIAEFAAPAGGRGPDRFDLIFANASLHWVPDHESLLEALTGRLAEGGQLAFQVPANFDHPSHTVAAEVAARPPFRAALSGDRPRGAVLAPEAYATLLDRLGYIEQHVRLQVYGHRLAASADVVEWVKGTLLTPYREQLDPAMYEEFVACYRAGLLDRLGHEEPYFYPFKRILAWARRQ